METIRHLMWQPAFDCIIKCKDCYINKCKDKNKLIPSDDNFLYIEKLLFFNYVKQFTISIGRNTSNKLKYQIYHLLENSLSKNFWFTFYSANDCIKFFDRIIDSNDIEYIAPLIGGISISNLLGDLDFLHKDICKKYSIKLNYNLLVNDEYNIAQDFLFWEAVHIVDSVYVICKKEPFDSYDESLVKSANECLKVYNDLNRYFSNTPIYLDNCLQCALSKSIIKDCNSGVVHVWPNNEHTKCPYNVNQVPNDNFNNCLFKELKCQ